MASQGQAVAEATPTVTGCQGLVEVKGATIVIKDINGSGLTVGQVSPDGQGVARQRQRATEPVPGRESRET